jgi:hypothetical protein
MMIRVEQDSSVDRSQGFFRVSYMREEVADHGGRVAVIVIEFDGLLKMSVGPLELAFPEVTIVERDMSATLRNRTRGEPNQPSLGWNEL